MNKERLFELMNDLDEDLILRAEAKPKTANVRTGKSRSVWLRIGALAACFCILFGAVFAILLIVRNSKSAHIPVWEDALYSADEIGKLFDAQYYGSAPTNAYTEVCVPNSDYLYISDLPDEEYLDVYQYSPPAVPVDKEEFEAFLYSFSPNLSKSLGIKFSQYEIQSSSHYLSSGLQVLQDIGNYTVIAYQNEYCSFVSLKGLSSDNRTIVLDGEPIQIDQRLTDADIIASLDGIKAKLYYIFGTSFQNVRVVRSYNEYSPYGAGMIRIYFYNEDEHPLNTMDGKPVSDYIMIEFENSTNLDTVSEAVVCATALSYEKNRGDVSKYQIAANAKKISLADAETLLYNGYVFGGHSCPRCMALQDKVSFEGYDFADIEYVFAYDRQKFNLGIPFYAFYKKIGTAENGNLIYAKTYVPAIEVSGYAAYFKSQQKNHESD